jgi:fructose-1,6-bisphosphatase II
MLDICGSVVIGEGIKDNAPGIFVGEKLGTWRPGSPRFNIALDPVDGTTNLAKGSPNSISVIAAAEVPENAPSVMRHLPSYYSQKIAYGPAVAEALHAEGNPCLLQMPLTDVLRLAAKALGKRVQDVVVIMLDRPRHADLVRTVREVGAGLRLIGDGDITAAVAPSLPGSGVDLYVGMGGSPEAILAAAALKCLGGDMEVRMWFHTEEHRREVAAQVKPQEMERVYRVDDLVVGESALFCATGISDSALLPGIKFIGGRVETHSVLMRARTRTVRHIHAIHNLDHKIIPLRSQP